MELKSPAKEIEYKPVVQEDGTIKLKRKDAIKRGKKSKAKGGSFELRVRQDLEAKGWIVDKWSNNVDLEERNIVPAKRKYNPFSKALTIGTGFPDFIALQPMGKGRHKLIGVEVKTNGKLSRIEKLKAKWYIRQEVFSEFFVAKKTKEKNRIRIEYIPLEEIIRRMR